MARDNMAQPRRQNDATILADGTVLITGGSSVAGWNDPTGQIATAEIWDPQTEQVTQVAAASDVYRGYHSTATLLPDGRVLITGGDHDHGGFSENLNAEIYSPAYLSTARGRRSRSPRTARNWARRSSSKRQTLSHCRCHVFLSPARQRMRKTGRNESTTWTSLRWPVV